MNLTREKTELGTGKGALGFDRRTWLDLTKLGDSGHPPAAHLAC
ncbi:MAG: hypothetical protein V4772_02770 [Pseudomonadota bacterium]